MMRTLKRIFLLACFAVALQAPALAAGVGPDPAVASDLIRLINEVRKQAGLLPVAANPSLMQVAQVRAANLAEHRSLSAPAQPVGQRFMAAGYDYAVAVEVVGGGHPSPEETVTDWLAYPDNHDTLLTGAVNDIGVGFVFRPDDGARHGLVYYWVVDMGFPVERGPGP